MPRHKCQKPMRQPCHGLRCATVYQHEIYQPQLCEALVKALRHQILIVLNSLN